MQTYIRFMVDLAFGLAGVSLVLKVLLDGLFNDWDVVADVEATIKAMSDSKGLALSGRREDVMLEIEKSRASTFSTRLIDIRREQLKEIDDVEHRLSLPNHPISLTPIPPPPIRQVPS